MRKRGLAGEARLEEAVGLAAAISLDIRHSCIVRLSELRPATLFGTGKVEELGVLVKTEGASLVVVDHVLSPVQQRNPERAWGAKVLDRTGLILEIFGERARERRPTPGGTGPSHVAEIAARALLNPSGAPARFAGLHRWLRRNADRGRSPDHSETHHEAGEGAGAGTRTRTLHREQRRKVRTPSLRSLATRTPESPRCSTGSPRCM